MDRNEKIAIGVVGGTLFLGGIVYAVTRPSEGKPTPGTGPASFTVRVVNLPAGADHWGLAFQNPTTGIWYQRANLPFPPPPGAGLLLPTDVAPMSVPVSAGILSIGAAAGSGGTGNNGVVVPIVVASYEINISVVNGGSYTFDFNTQVLS